MPKQLVEEILVKQKANISQKITGSKLEGKKIILVTRVKFGN